MTLEPRQAAFLINEMKRVEKDEIRRSSARAEARGIRKDAEPRLTE
jgi:hypothetical protein